MERQLSFDSTPASLIIFILTIGASLYAFYGRNNIYEKWVLHPYSLVRKKRWHTLITSGFIHADYLHLIFNIMAFYYFGFALEETFTAVTGSPAIGSLYFIAVYFLSMVLADLSTVIKNRDNPNYTSLGASGAISGVVFSFILFYPTAKMGMLFIPIGIPAPVFGFLYLTYCWFAAKNNKDRINHDAHLWGSLAGLIITTALVPQALQYFIRAVFGE